MFTPPRHHGPSKRANRRGQVSAAVRTILHVLDEENRRWEWREACWQRRQQRGWVPRRGQMSGYPPPRPFQGTPRPRRWLPDCGRDQRWGGTPNHFPQRQPPWDWRSRVLPRRGPPVAAIRVPRWPRQELCGRQPRGFEPRGTLRGGPKGQPKILIANLEADCGEAPKGQPGIHSCCTRTSPKARPSVGERGSKKPKKKTNHHHGG